MYTWRTDDDFIIITVWVDNMLIFAMTVKLKLKAISDIENEWEITDLGIPTKIVGIETVGWTTVDNMMIVNGRQSDSQWLMDNSQTVHRHMTMVGRSMDR